MDASDLRRKAAEYYAARLQQHGTTPRGVDWNGEESQFLRFRQLLRIGEGLHLESLGDYGCGYAALLEYVRATGFQGRFLGYDAAPEMITAAQARHQGDPLAEFSASAEILEGAQVVVASGLFNVKGETPVSQWEKYVEETLEEIARYAPQGFAFNMLTSYSDADRMRPDLYYPDPCKMFDLCKRRYSRQVALLHDYGLYEFTILVRK